MNLSETILPDSIAVYPHLLAFDIAFKRQLEKIPLEKLLVYMVDRVPEEALPILAEQFDVLGYKGMRLASTVQDKRNLIKRAIELHRYKGTIYAIEEALKSVGFANAKIIEHVNSHWAKFSVDLTASGVQLTSAGLADVLAMVKEYKNARSQLEAVQIVLQVDDVIDLNTDDVFIAPELVVDDTITFTGALYRDGSGMYDGTHDHSSDSDIVESI
jgi:phage tail P2-like protein